MNTPHDDFFESIEPVAQDMAKRLGIDPSWILGLGAFESGWFENPGSVDQNNPFGITKPRPGSNDSNDRVPQHFDTVEDAVDAWEHIFGEQVRGATSAQDFVRRLQDTKAHNAYNSEDKQGKAVDWARNVLGCIKGVQVRQDIRASRVTQ